MSLCTATRQPDGTYRCPHGLRWDADFKPIGGDRR